MPLSREVINQNIEQSKAERQAALDAEEAAQANALENYLAERRQLEDAERQAREAVKIPYAYVQNKETGEILMDGFTQFEGTFDAEKYELVTPEEGAPPADAVYEDRRPVNEKLRDAFMVGLGQVMQQLDGATLVDMAMLKTGLDEAAKLLPPEKFVEGAIAKIQAFQGLPPEAEPVRVQLLALLGV
jgi:hypothetical protein